MALFPSGPLECVNDESMPLHRQSAVRQQSTSCGTKWNSLVLTMAAQGMVACTRTGMLQAEHTRRVGCTQAASMSS